MSEDEMERLAVHFAKALQQARSVSDSEHYDHHIFIKERIEETKERRLFWEDMRRHVGRWGAISIISGAGYALYLGLTSLVKIALKAAA